MLQPWCKGVAARANVRPMLCSLRKSCLAEPRICDGIIILSTLYTCRYRRNSARVRTHRPCRHNLHLRKKERRTSLIIPLEAAVNDYPLHSRLDKQAVLIDAGHGAAPSVVVWNLIPEGGFLVEVLHTIKGDSSGALSVPVRMSCVQYSCTCLFLGISMHTRFLKRPVWGDLLPACAARSRVSC